MTKKRKQPESNHNDTFHPKRSRFSQTDGGEDGNPLGAQPRLDPTYGQRGAFPGLDDTVAQDDLFYGPANDGLEYLRMVRSEAKGVPNLLVAPRSPTKESKEDGLYDDYPQGYYADGAYTAAPLPSSYTARSGVEEEEDLDPQEAYYSALCARFTEMSEILQSPPPPPNGLPDPPPNYKPSQWRYKFMKTTPKMAVLAQIPQEMVIRGLEIMEDVLTAGNLRSTSGKNIGAWAWCLLTRCREVGQMGSEDVGVLRKFGKKAVWLLRRIAAGEVVEEVVVERDDVEEEDDGDGDAVEEVEDGMGVSVEGGEDLLESSHIAIDPIITTNNDSTHASPPPETDAIETALAEAKKRILASLPITYETNDSSKPEIPQNTVSETVDTIRTGELGHEQPTVTGESTDKEAILATLDMIVTVVGEFYGQRDLLDGRLLWDEMG